jgi:hypothetical protein
MNAVVALLVAVAALVTGCGSRHAHGRPCTLIGCDSALFVRLRDKPAGTSTVELCSGGRCVRLGRDTDAIQLALGHRTRGGAVPLALTFRDASNRVISQARRNAQLRRAQPNGPGCAPVCYQAAFTWAHGRLS